MAWQLRRLFLGRPSNQRRFPVIRVSARMYQRLEGLELHTSRVYPAPLKVTPSPSKVARGPSAENRLSMAFKKQTGSSPEVCSKVMLPAIVTSAPSAKVQSMTSKGSKEFSTAIEAYIRAKVLTSIWNGES